MKRKTWFTIGATVLVIGAYAVFFLEALPTPSRADPGGGLCLGIGVEIAWSDPAEGFIDAREIEDAGGNPEGITQIRVGFSESVALTSECIIILTTGDDSPVVQEVTANGNEWTIDLDRPIPAAESTAIVFDSGAASVVIHSRPGDVNLDGTTDDGDATALEEAIQAGATDLSRYDIDRDGNIDQSDASRLDDVLATFRAHVWPENPVPTVLCCCALGDCSIHVASVCDSEDTQVSCPCVPNPCEVVP